MNLEYDDDESDLLRQVGDLLERIAPVPASGREAPAAVWTGLVDAGLSELGAAVHQNELPLSIVVDLSRRAGRQLLVEQFVSSAYALPALSAAVADDDARRVVAARLRARPGVLLADGSSRLVPVVPDTVTAGVCFGDVPRSDLYRIVYPAGRFVLQRWDGPPPVVTPLAQLSLSIAAVAVDPAGGRWVGYPLRAGRATVDRLEAEVLLVHSAAMVGCAERLLEITLDHVRGRVQFGVPIGSFQAVKHGLADVYTALVVAWNAILSAAAAAAEEAAALASEQEIALLVARVLAVDAALSAARAGAQFHGGIGYTAELNVHLFLKTILDGAQRGGTPGDMAIELGRRFAASAC